LTPLSQIEITVEE